MTFEQRETVASIVVPCRGHAVELGRCLATLLTQEVAAPHEIIVVDAAADDRVVKTVRDYPSVKIVRSNSVLFPGAARNFGARHAGGGYLFFVDADCICDAGWLAAAMEALDGGARLVGGPVLHGDPWNPVAVVDNLMQFSDVSAHRPRGPIKLLPSCNLGVRRADFEALGGFPTIPFKAGEDVLFCREARLRWHETPLFVPEMRVRHFGRTGLRELWLHQELFGRARALYGLELSNWQRYLGQFAICAPAIGLKRLSYLVRRTATSNTSSLAALIFLFPILFYGLLAWCLGFRRGCQEIARP